MPKLRTINECYAMIHQEDSESAITTFFIRKLCKDNIIKHVRAGSKVMVNYDSLIEYLNKEII